MGGELDVTVEEFDSYNCFCCLGMNFRTRILESLHMLDRVHFCDVFCANSHLQIIWCNKKRFTIHISGSSPARFWNCLATNPTIICQKIYLRCILICFRLFILN